MTSTPISERPWVKPLAGLGVLVAVTILALVTLGSQVSGVLSTVGASVGGPGTVSGGDTTGGDTGNGSAGNGSAGSDSAGSDSTDLVLAVARDDQLLIKTGTFVLEVGSIDTAIATATARIHGLGGYASGSDRSGTGDGAQATITYRIPAARWDDAVAAVRGLALQVQLEKSTTEDVTSQVVDIGARIRNLEVTELALQKIMDRAGAIKDILTVQEQLTTVRGHIEELTAQQAHLESEAALSTLTATFVLKPTPVVVKQQAGYDPAVEVDKASATLVHVLQKGTTVGIWFGIVWLPILLALAIAGSIGLVIARQVRRMWLRTQEAAEPAT